MTAIDGSQGWLSEQACSSLLGNPRPTTFEDCWRSPYWRWVFDQWLDYRHPAWKDRPRALRVVYEYAMEPRDETEERPESENEDLLVPGELLPLLAEHRQDPDGFRQAVAEELNGFYPSFYDDVGWVKDSLRTSPELLERAVAQVLPGESDESSPEAGSSEEGGSIAWNTIDWDSVHAKNKQILDGLDEATIAEWLQCGHLLLLDPPRWDQALVEFARKHAGHSMGGRLLRVPSPGGHDPGRILSTMSLQQDEFKWAIEQTGTRKPVRFVTEDELGEAQEVGAASVAEAEARMPQPPAPGTIDEMDSRNRDALKQTPDGESVEFVAAAITLRPELVLIGGGWDDEWLRAIGRDEAPCRGRIWVYKDRARRRGRLVVHVSEGKGDNVRWAVSEALERVSDKRIEWVEDEVPKFDPWQGRGTTRS